MSSSDSSDAEMEIEKTGIVTPGEFITDDPIWMRGHGTYGDENATYSAVAGSVQRVNKLISVQPFHGRYIPMIGDHVVGRIIEVGNRRWRVDIGASRDATLQLGAVNLPGGILRRKSEDDELQMRDFLKEGDLLNAEVQQTYADGSAGLHTRSLRFGKLRNGVFVKVPASLVIRLRQQIYQLEDGVEIIMGINGYLWLRKSNGQTPAAADVSLNRLEQETKSEEIYRDTNEDISPSVRKAISRYANCINAMIAMNVAVSEERLRVVYDRSLAYAANELLEVSVREHIVGGTSA